MPPLPCNYWYVNPSPVVLNVPGLEHARKYHFRGEGPAIVVQDYIEIRFDFPKGIFEHHYLPQYGHPYYDWMKAENLAFGDENGAENGSGWRDWRETTRKTNLKLEEWNGFWKYSRLFQELANGHKHILLRLDGGFTGPVRPHSVIPNDTIEDGDFVGDQRWIKKCQKLRALGDNEKLIHYAVEWKRWETYLHMQEATHSEKGENGDFVALSKLEKLKEVLTKVKEVMEMGYGMDQLDQDVELPNVGSWVDERRLIEPPALPKLSRAAKREFWADHYYDRDEDDWYDSDTYDIEEVTQEYYDSTEHYLSDDLSTASPGTDASHDGSAEEHTSDDDAASSKDNDSQDDGSGASQDKRNDKDEADTTEEPAPKRQRRSDSEPAFTPS